MNDSMSLENDVLHRLNPPITQQQERFRISNISQSSIGRFWPSFDGIRTSESIFDPPFNQKDSILTSNLQSTLPLPIIHTNYIEMVKEKCITKAHLIERVIKECKESQNCFIETLENKRKALETLVREQFATTQKILEGMEKDFLLAIDKSVILDLDRLKELNQGITALEEESKCRRRNIRDMQLNDNFLADCKQDPMFHGIMHPQKILSQHSTTICMQPYLLNLLNSLDATFVNLKAEMEKGLWRIGIIQSEHKRDQEASDGNCEMSASQANNNKDIKEKLELIGMKHYVTVQEGKGISNIIFQDCSQLSHNSTNKLEINSRTIGLYLYQYHELKQKFQLTRSDFLSGVDYLIQGLPGIKVLEYETNLRNIIKEVEDLSVILEYQFGNGLKMKKTLSVDVDFYQVEGQYSQISLLNQFLKLSQSVEEIVFHLKTIELSDERIETLIKVVLPLRERFDLFRYIFTYSGEMESTLAILSVITAEMRKSRVCLHEIRMNNRGVYIDFNFPDSSCLNARSLLIALVLEDTSALTYNKADLFRIIAKTIALPYYKRIEKDYLEQENLTSALLFLKNNNTLKKAQ